MIYVHVCENVCMRNLCLYVCANACVSDVCFACLCLCLYVHAYVYACVCMFYACVYACACANACHLQCEQTSLIDFATRVRNVHLNGGKVLIQIRRCLLGTRKTATRYPLHT